MNHTARLRGPTSTGSVSSTSSPSFLAPRRLCSFLILGLGIYRVNTRVQTLEKVPCVGAVARIDPLPIGVNRPLHTFTDMMHRLGVIFRVCRIWMRIFLRQEHVCPQRRSVVPYSLMKRDEINIYLPPTTLHFHRNAILTCGISTITSIFLESAQSPYVMLSQVQCGNPPPVASASPQFLRFVTPNTSPTGEVEK